MWKRGGIDRTCLAILHNGAALYARDAGKLDGLAPEAYIQPQDSILDNADWESGIINQQAKDEYTDGGCTIDRWSVNSKNVKLKVLKGKISVEILKETTVITWAPSQDIESPERFEGKTLTAATVIDFIDGDWSLFIRFANDNEYIAGPQKKLKAGLNILSYTVPEGTTHIKCGILSQAQAAGKSVQVRKIKLESGPYFTGWPVWNYALELAKCQRYQYYKSGLWKFLGIGICPGSINGKYELTMFVALPVTMRTNPVAAFENLYVTGGVSSYKTHKVTGIRAVQDYIGGVELALQTDDTLEIGVPYYLAIKDTNGYFYLNANL